MFAALGGEVLKVPTAGTAVLRAGGEWRESGTPGFLVKPLVEDEAAGVRTWLMKSEPGASSAPHCHDEIEQVYVLEGRFSDGETTYGPGDFFVRAPGTIHSTIGQVPTLSLVIYTADPRGAA